MKKSLLMLTLIALFGASAVSAANMKIPMAFEYLALDGQKVKKSVFMHKSKLKLSPGQHEIALRYHDMVESEVSDTDEDVKSPAFIITLNVTDGADYYLEVGGNGEIDDPREFALAPDVVVTRKGGGKVDYKLTHTDIEEKSFNIQLYGQSPEQQKPALVSHNAPTTAAAAAQYTPEPELVSTPVGATTAAAAPAPATGTTATPEQMLHLWWQRADEKTRKEFLSWAVQQL